MPDMQPDTSIYPKPTQSNPLDMASQIVGIRNALLQGQQQQQALQRGQIDIHQAQFDLAQKHVQAVGSYVSPLLNDPNATADDVIRAAGNAVATGVVQADEASRFVSGITSDPRGIHHGLTNYMLMLQDNLSRMNAIQPPPTNLNTGSGTLLQRQPQFGPVQNLAFTPSGLPPTQPTVGGPSGTQAGVIGPQNQPPQTQSLSPEAVAPAQGSAAPQGGFVPTGLPAGAGTVIGGRAEQTAHANAALVAANDAVPGQLATLSNLDRLVDQFKSGEGSDFLRVAKNFVNTQSPFGNVFDPKSIASQEDFNKQATMLSAQQMSQLGLANTNAQVELTSHLSPNELLTRQGNHEIIGMLKGNAEAIRAKNAAWQKYYRTQPPGTADYGQWSDQFNQTFDPRVFQAKYLTPDQRKQLIDRMSPDERNSFFNNYGTAIQNGWVKDPRKKS